mmetsp:Transcript_10795/g.12661  ORF Transcript_10795/g.12661 Transcript_10795/m.12661 type:complete len:189 (-) Transcript_10795:452-1018(-)
MIPLSFKMPRKKISCVTIWTINQGRKKEQNQRHNTCSTEGFCGGGFGLRLESCFCAFGILEGISESVPESAELPFLFSERSAFKLLGLSLSLSSYAVRPLLSRSTASSRLFLRRLKESDVDNKLAPYCDSMTRDLVGVWDCEKLLFCCGPRPADVEERDVILEVLRNFLPEHEESGVSRPLEDVLSRV